MSRIMERRAVGLWALLVVVGCAVGVRQARAEIIAIQDWSGTMQYTTSFKGVTGGYEFTVHGTPITITKLGFFDYGADGLGQPHDVGIWELGNTTALATATVTTNSPLEGPMIAGAGQFRYEELASAVELSANTTYRIGAYYSSTHTDAWAQSNGTVAWTTADEISYVDPRYRYDSALAYPDNELSPRELAYFGPNFQFVPEPGTLGLLLGVGVFAVIARRRRSC